MILALPYLKWLHTTIGKPLLFFGKKTTGMPVF